MVDWDGLENRSRCKPTVGLNPTPSAAVRAKWHGHDLQVGERAHIGSPAQIGPKRFGWGFRSIEFCDMRLWQVN